MGPSRERACIDVLDPRIRHDTLPSDAKSRASVDELEHCYLYGRLAFLGILLLRGRQS